MRDPQKTKELIEKTALRLFVEKGVTETTIKDIAREAKLSEGAMYRHYPGKEDLAWDLFSINLSLFVEGLERVRKPHKTLKAQLKAMVRFAYDLYEENPYLFRYLLLSEHIQRKKVTPDMPHTFHILRKAIAEGMKRGEIPKQDPVLAASMVYGLIRSVAVSSVMGRLKGKLGKHVESVANASWRALKT